MREPLRITNPENGRIFEVQLLLVGEGYHEASLYRGNEPIVEFIDVTDGKPQITGAQYYVSTMLEHSDAGLLLHGGSPQAWYVTSQNVKDIQLWLLAQLATVDWRWEQ